MKNYEKAFTLSEVLITLVVIGVVAAITVPMLLHQEGDRVNSERHANIVYKIAQATDMMKAHGVLGKFATTDDFVDELQKYLKINKRCDSEHIAECWTTSKVKTMSGEEYEVKDAKTRKDLLGNEINQPDNPNVGIVLADGASLILTYNPDNEGMSAGEAIVHTPGLLPVGNGKEEFLNFTSNSMSGLAFVFDVNGNRGQNSEQQHGSLRDIRSFNEARFVTATEPSVVNPCDKYTATKKLAVDSTCYFELPTTYKWVDAVTACENTVSGATFAGSPDFSTLRTSCRNIKAQNGDNTTSPFSSGTFWTISEGTCSIGNYGTVDFPACTVDCHNKSNGYYVLCKGQ